MNILTFTTLYPNDVQPSHGIFVEHRLRNLVEQECVCAKVLAPVPWFPLSHARYGPYAEFARVPRVEQRCGLEVFHPRYPVIPKVGMTIAPVLLATAMLPRVRQLKRTGFDFDLIDSHFLYPDGVAAVMLGRMLDIPVVMTARGTDVHTYLDMAIVRRQILWAISQAARVITVSHALEEALRAAGVKQQTLVTLRNGVDLELFSPSARGATRRKLGMERCTLLCVGNLRRLKGHALVLRALQALPDVDLIIVGRGEECSNLRQMAYDLGFESRVRFMPPLPQSELREYYSAADVLVLASEKEGWPNVLLESMACDTPVVAADVWGVGEVVSAAPAGRLFAPRTPEALVAAVERLLADYPSPGATRQFAERFSWDDVSRGQMGVFRTALAGRTMSEGIA